jgi:hypothetical protein
LEKGRCVLEKFRLVMHSFISYEIQKKSVRQNQF